MDLMSILILFAISGDTSSECSLPKDGGGCDNKIFRYYYNAIEVSTMRNYVIFEKIMIVSVKCYLDSTNHYFLLETMQNLYLWRLQRKPK